MTEEFTTNAQEKENMKESELDQNKVDQNLIFKLADAHVIRYSELAEPVNTSKDSKVLFPLPHLIDNCKGQTANHLTIMKVGGQYYTIFVDVNGESGSIRFELPKTLVDMLLDEHNKGSESND